MLDWRSRASNSNQFIVERPKVINVFRSVYTGYWGRWRCCSGVLVAGSLIFTSGL
ncbi:hypothetical protein BD779DRAFT_1526398 [Infundibulicybe gibba]|nr:hypothetical protein BD779DRAFT_1554727 [Infundibulicybe gibba]KAF8887839.1 hypothetical protein BD779DRAFT_1526398 [Infundibulicybe gibba]